MSVFELVSAYGTVGLSLGLPTARTPSHERRKSTNLGDTGELLVLGCPETVI